MPQLRNSKGEIFEVSDADAVRMHEADPSLEVVGNVRVSGDGDAPISMAAGQVLTQEGKTAATPQEQQAYSHKEYLKDKTSVVGAGVRGGLSMLSAGLSDRAFSPETIEADESIHPYARGAGEIAVGLGTLAWDPASLLGLGAEAGRAGAAGRELAMAGDALTAEHVGSAISSKALMAGEATTTAERGLLRAGKAIDESKAVRAGMEGVPADLAGLDAKGLRQAAKDEKLAIQKEIEAERLALEDARKPLREEAANEVRTLHEDLSAAGERPIYSKISTQDLKTVAPELKGIKGVQTAQVALADSFKTTRKLLRNSVAIGEDPYALIKPLQARQGALETLQARMPEITEALGGDVGALVHVDDALMQTRAQIAKIQSLAKGNPVTSARLQSLKAGMSPRMSAIEAAQEALAKAPEIGLVQKGAQSAVFAGATAVAHAIPGVGVLAPFVGKWASEAVGGMFGGLAKAGSAAATGARKAADTFLSLGSRVARNAPVTATQILGSHRFGSSAEPDGKHSLPELFKARSAEVRSQTMFDPMGNVVVRPETRQAIADRLTPVSTVNPLLGDKLESLAVRKLEFISSKIPRQPDVGGLQIGPDTWQPSELAIRSWARTIKAVEDPGSVEEGLAQGMITPEAAEAYRMVYPERFAAMQQYIFQKAPTLSKTLPMDRKIALSVFSGVPLIPALQPNVKAVLQSTFAMEPNTEGGMRAPSPAPNFGAMGSLEKPTRAQETGAES